MLTPLVLLALLILIAQACAVATWALIEAERTGALDTGDYDGGDDDR